MKIPSEEECLEVLHRNKTPPGVIEHTKAVARFAGQISDILIARGEEVNKPLVVAAALLHDVERVHRDHELKGAALLTELGYPEVAEVVKRHGFYRLDEYPPRTVEEKIMFYADKRTKSSATVSLDERFKDLLKRYGGNYDKERAFTEAVEKELNVDV